MLQISESEFLNLVIYVKANFGIDLESKRQLVEGRLGSHVANCGFGCFGDYFRHVCGDGGGRALSDLVSRITTNHTAFFREPGHFAFLADTVLPQLERTLRDREIRIWSAGCSTGEEPYTIAIALHEYFGINKSRWDTRILATDISAPVLDAARGGIYPASVLESVPPVIGSRYFRSNGPGRVEVADRIRRDVLFRSLNLVEDTFPLRKRFHVIFCRNVMIYFDQQTKARLVERLLERTEPGGYLLIGHAESVNRACSGWQYIRPAVYRKPVG